MIQKFVIHFSVLLWFLRARCSTRQHPICHTQDVVDPLLFTTSGEEHVIPKEAIKGVVSNINITVVDNETIEIDEGEYYLLLALLNGSIDTTSCNEADEEPFADNYFEEQGDEDSMTTDVGQPQGSERGQ